MSSSVPTRNGTDGRESKRLKVGAEGGKKKLILNAFIEMCKSSPSQKDKLPSSRQDVAINLRVCGAIQTINLIDSITSIAGRARRNF
jgi:hypothetical protein